MSPGWKVFSENFSEVDRRDVEQFAVLRNSATRHDDALLAEDFRKPGVRERFFAVLGTDQLLDQRPDRG